MALVLLAALAGCTSRGTSAMSSSGSPAAPSSGRGAIPVASSRSPSSTSPPASSPPGGARNLVASTRVKLQLLATWTAAQHVPAADVSGTTPGSVHYGIAPIGDYWAVAGFTPSARARAGGAEVMAQFQDGPWVFSRPVGGRWRLVTDSGGVLCPDEVPAALAAIWGIRDSAQCRPQPPATPSS